jgi:hypothetical protein
MRSLVQRQNIDIPIHCVRMRWQFGTATERRYTNVLYRLCDIAVS